MAEKTVQDTRRRPADSIVDAGDKSEETDEHVCPDAFYTPEC